MSRGHERRGAIRRRVTVPDTILLWREARVSTACRYVQVRMHARKCVSRAGVYASRAARDTPRARVAARGRASRALRLDFESIDE